MDDERSPVGKYLVVFILWIIPVVLILIPLLYPTEGYVRDMLVLPVIVILIYVAFILAPLFYPIKNADFFDEVPKTIERFANEQRARKDVRDILKLYHGGRLPNVYELTELTPFQKDIKRMCERLRADVEWHSSNAEMSRELLDRMEALMHAREEADEEDAQPQSDRKPPRRTGKTGKRR